MRAWVLLGEDACEILSDWDRMNEMNQDAKAYHNQQLRVFERLDRRSERIRLVQPKAPKSI